MCQHMSFDVLLNTTGLREKYNVRFCNNQKKIDL